MSARILLVDDHEAILADYLRILAGPARESFDDLEAAFGQPPRASTSVPSYELRTASQGMQAVELATAAIAVGRPFDVAFVDIQMPPGIDGVETVLHLWRLQPDLEIVLCTAFSHVTWSEIHEKVGTTGQLVILRKPFDPIEVRQLAACLVEKSRRGRALADRIRMLEEQVATEVAARMARANELHLAQKFAALGQLAAGVAHEINTPVHYVGASLEFLAETIPELVAAIHAPDASLEAAIAEIPQALLDASEGISRITRIVRGIREFAHPGHAREVGAVDINEQIRLAVELARGEYRHIADVVLALGDLPQVTGHADELGQVVLNLVVNAAHAIVARGPRRGRIEITSARCADQVTIDVADDGIGIPESERDRVFDPFFTTKAVGLGTGQGLAISRACIVTGHGGTIAFDSEVGRGTTFHITLPVGLQ